MDPSLDVDADFLAFLEAPHVASAEQTSSGTPGSSHDANIATSVSPLSCVQCRAKKKRCDRVKPYCGRCVQLANNCVYPQSRQVSVGKRKQVHELEAKIGELEHLIRRGNNAALTDQAQYGESGDEGEAMIGTSYTESAPMSTPIETDFFAPMPTSGLSSSEMTRLHLLEQLPPLQLILDLTAIYFRTLHHGSPMLNKQRFMASLHLPAHMRPPMCLQYAVIAVAATISEPHHQLAIPFYQRAKAYATSDEMGGMEEQPVTLALAQCWSLIAYFEAEHVMFSRASLSLCRSVRIAQMLRLHRIDEEKVSTEPHQLQDWTDLEEQRRTWWVIFCSDRLVSATTKWPTLIQEQHIETLLPASDEAYSTGIAEKTSMLADVPQTESCSPFATRVRVAHLFYNSLEHASQVNLDVELDPNLDPYWNQHRKLDNDLAVVLLSLPSSLRLPENYNNQSAIFINILIHTATICLHRAALYRMKSQTLPDHIRRQCQHRLLPAAEEILHVFRIASNLRISLMNPLINFSAYISALVFLEDTLSDYSSQGKDNLEFLLKIMAAIGKENTVTRSLAGQLAKEMTNHGIHSSTIEMVNRLEPGTEIVPLLATLGPNSPNVIFCFQ